MKKIAIWIVVFGTVGICALMNAGISISPGGSSGGGGGGGTNYVAGPGIIVNGTTLSIDPSVVGTNNGGFSSNEFFVSATFQPTNVYPGTNITGVGTNNQNWAKLAFYNSQPFLNRGDQFNLNVVDQYWIVGITNVDATHKIYSVYPPLKHTYAVETNVIVSPAAAQWHDDNGNPGASVGGDGTYTEWGNQGTLANSGAFVWGNDVNTFLATIQDDNGGLGKYWTVGNPQIIGGTQTIEVYKPKAGQNIAESLVIMPDGTVSLPSGITNKTGGNMILLSPLQIKVPAVAYNGDTLAGNGLGALVGSVTATGQVASIGSSTLFTSPNATSLYRVSGEVLVTTAATTGTITLTIGYTDAIGSTTSVPVNTSSTATQARYSITPFEFATTATAITYSTTLVNTTGAATYALHLRLEKL